MQQHHRRAAIERPFSRFVRCDCRAQRKSFREEQRCRRSLNPQGWSAGEYCLANRSRGFSARLTMAIARASRLARAAGKQMAATGRPGRLTRPVRMKPGEAPLPVRAPQGQEIWDTPNIKAAVGMALGVVLAKLTMMYDESLEPERIERQAKEFAEVQANLKPLSEDQWEEIQELRPRTPFESKIGRSHARIRTGEALSLEDIKDWATDVLVEAMMRKEETVQRSFAAS